MRYYCFRETARPAGRLRFRTVFYAITSVTGLALRSASGIGRPTLLMFVFSGFNPSTLHTVAIRSAELVGRSSTTAPSLLVLPTAWPPFTPPPAITVLHEVAQ